ncbi:MAG: helix-hairpin-helix domain-containing protein [Hespellia sp.]|nr:helix-hairpin-helix domain-containing protein [Hespellia sp.]
MRRSWRKLCVCMLAVTLVSVMTAGCGQKKDVMVEESLREAQGAKDTVDNLKDEASPEVESGKGNESGQDGESAGKPEEEKECSKETNIFVYVCGAVNAPGVYEVAAESRIFQVIDLAGGMTEAADASYLNQAAFVADGDKVYIPTCEEVAQGTLPQDASSGQAAAGSQSDSGKVNINTAPEEQLMTIPGVGQSRAASIIAYREQKGAFAAIEDIMNVEGIKEGLFNKMKDTITVD